MRSVLFRAAALSTPFTHVVPSRPEQFQTSSKHVPLSAVVVHRMQDDDEGREAEPPLPMPSREAPREAGKLTEETRGSNSKMRFFCLTFHNILSHTTFLPPGI